MATPSIISVPNSACFASVVMTLTRVVGVTESPFTLEEQAFRWPGERWSMSLRMPPITNRIIAGEWQSFFASLKGRYNHFLMGDPAARQPMGVATGSPVVNGLGQSGNNLSTSGWSPSVQNILRRGDYIQLGSGPSSRLHMIVEDANSNASGISTLSIEPALRVSPADGSSVVVNDPKGVFRLAQNDVSWSTAPGKIWSFSLEAIEVL